MDKRIERTIRNARQTAIDVLATRGFADFTMEAVAEVSGISKSTLYRHWPDRMALLTDALKTLNRQPGQEKPMQAQTVRGRVIELIAHLASVFADSSISRVIPALIEAAERHPEVASFLHEYSATRRRTLENLLKEGVSSGELPATLDPCLVAVVLSGPIFYRRFMTDTPVAEDEVARLVDFVLR